MVSNILVVREESWDILNRSRNIDISSLVENWKSSGILIMDFL